MKHFLGLSFGLLAVLPLWSDQCQCPVYASVKDCNSCAQFVYEACREEAASYLHCPDNLTDRSYAMYRLQQCEPQHSTNMQSCQNTCPP